MTTYTPGERVHVKTPLGDYNLDEDATYVMANPSGYEFAHVVNLDRGSRLQFRDFEVTPAESTTLIENAEWPEAVAKMGEELETGANRKRRYTITFEENEA